MASKAKITKAVRGRKVKAKNLSRGRRLKSFVVEHLAVLKALEKAVETKSSSK